jgi:uncharacterized protein (AIM24 family)
MAEKMGRALAAQSTPSGLHLAVPKQAPKTVVLGDEEAKPPPPPPDEETIEVMSVEELPSDVYVVPDEVPPAPPPAPPPSAPGLHSDWGAQLKPATENGGEMRFAEDEGPPETTLLQAAPASVEELPVLEAEVVPNPSSPPPTPAWLTMEAAEARREPPPVSSDSGWVTESVAEVPLPPTGEPAQGPVWTETPLPMTAPVAADDPSWAAQPPADDSSWQQPAEPAVTDDASWATQPAATETVVAETWSQAPATDGSSWSEPAPADASWQQPVEAAPTGEPTLAEQPAVADSTTPDDASWATQPAASVEPLPTTDDAAWATQPPATVEPLPTTPDDASWATQPAAATEPLPTAADDASWATQPAVSAEPLPTTPDDASWATQPAATVEPLPTPDDASWATQPAVSAEPLPTTPDDAWAAPDARTTAPAEIPAPEPSAPLPITVEEPVDAPPPAAPPAGYTPMSPQRLVDLGASGAWVQEPTAGPFHVSSDGLAVTVAGEMLMRMGGLVAVVGSLNVAPEHRRRRGRPTTEPFGAGPNQLQRVTGNGMVYLEPGRAKFHAVDLTDQNGVNIDDDGAYLREELVFAFEEPISFENGKLSSEGQSLELAHLKGNGRVLLQLDGSLRAMPIPPGAPLVVPLQRVVGWFGRVTPRLMGFGGRGAIELTGEGYALLGTPAERA